MGMADYNEDRHKTRLALASHPLAIVRQGACRDSDLPISHSVASAAGNAAGVAIPMG